MTPQLWLLDVDALELDRLIRLLRFRKFGVSNVSDIDVAEYEHQKRIGELIGQDVPVPEDFPAPLLTLPKRGFAPDYFTFNGLRFCSRRFRETLAQPPTIVQWTDVDVVYGGPAVLRQDYKVLRGLAHQPAMDLQRSECRFEQLTDPKTGTPRLWPASTQRFAFITDIKPLTEMFRIEEHPSYVLVTDALAELVLQGGCTGMEFTDPNSPQSGQRIERYRTATGIAERRVHF